MNASSLPGIVALLVTAILGAAQYWWKNQEEKAREEREKREREEREDRARISSRIGALETAGRARDIADAKRDERESHTAALLEEIRDELREMRRALQDRGSHPEWRR
jgi:uncharacterized protein HemX